jgi:hypothetical protein
MVTFGATGAPQRFVVPSGVTSLTVRLAGGQGAGAADVVTGELPGRGGKGAIVDAVVPVAPGQVLWVHTGEAGPPAQFTMPAGTTVCPTAFGGGGRTITGVAAGTPACGPGGGGASDIRSSGGTLADRLVVAGAGGSAFQQAFFFPSSNCSIDGGDSGQQGVGRESPFYCAWERGGGAGTLTAGGRGTRYDMDSLLNVGNLQTEETPLWSQSQCAPDAPIIPAEDGSWDRAVEETPPTLRISVVVQRRRTGRWAAVAAVGTTGAAADSTVRST